MLNAFEESQLGNGSAYQRETPVKERSGGDSECQDGHGDRPAFRRTCTAVRSNYLPSRRTCPPNPTTILSQIPEKTKPASKSKSGVGHCCVLVRVSKAKHNSEREKQLTNPLRRCGEHKRKMRREGEMQNQLRKLSPFYRF